MKNKLKVFLLVFASISLNANANDNMKNYDYPWTERHEVLTDYITKYKKRVKEFTPYKIKRSEEYLREIEMIMIDEGVPKELAILAAIESGFKENAISQSNAVGMWQFKAATAREWGLIVNKDVDERKDWKKASRAAAKYLKWLAEKNFNGNYETAILSYNAGVGNVKNLINDLGVDDPWILISYEEYLPLESREFLPKYITFMHYFYYLKKNKKIKK